MQVCHAKFKPRDAAEVMFITNMVERVTELVKKHNLPITKIRFGRQVKAWGSTAVSDYHVYRYWDADETKEFWINGHECDMSEEGMRYLEWSLIKGCFRF